MKKIKIFKKLTINEKRDIERERIKSLYAEGYSINEILEFVNQTYESIQRYLKTEGLLRESKRFTQEIEKELIFKLFKDGKTFMQIASELKVPAAYVSSVLKQNNLLNSKYSYAGKEFDSSHQMKKYKKEIINNIQLDFINGKTLDDIKKNYSLSMKAIKIIISRIS